MIEQSADREMIETFLDTGAGFIDEDAEAKPQALKGARDSLLTLAGERQDDANAYLGMIEIVKELYT
jgi:hypothetical protein